MKTSTVNFKLVKIDWAKKTPLKNVIGKTGTTILDDGTSVIGTIEAPNRFSSTYPILRMMNGKWVRLTDEILVAKAGA